MKKVEVAYDLREQIRNTENNNVKKLRLPEPQATPSSSIIEEPSLRFRTEARLKENCNYVCDLCAKRFKYKSHLKRHILQVHSSSCFFECYFQGCSKSFKTRDSLRNYNKTHYYELHKCLKCCKLYTGERNLELHIKRIHPSSSRPIIKERSFKCSICHKAYIHEKHLKLHSKVHHKKTCSYVCDLCQKKFKVKDKLNRHFLFFHSGFRPYKCNFQACSKSFKTSESLSIHNKTHYTELCKCLICNKFLSDKKSLKRHEERVHQKLKRFQCHLCAYMFFRMTDLTGHLQNHIKNPHLKPRSTIDPSNLFECSKLNCSKFYRTARSLRQHELTHSGH